MDLLPKVKAGRLPDLPAEIRTCLLKEACRVDAVAAKKASKPVPDCKTADDILINYVQTEKEKIACTRALGRWWKEQQNIEASADGYLKDGHPRTGKAPAKGATWP